MASKVGSKDAAYSSSLAKWLQHMLAGFHGTEAAKKAAAGGERSPLAGFHPDQAQFSLGFLCHFPQGREDACLKDTQNKLETDADRTGAKLSTFCAFSCHASGEMFKGLFIHLCTLLP